MNHITRRTQLLSGLSSLFVLFGIYACGATGSDQGVGSGFGSGSSGGPAKGSGGSSSGGSSSRGSSSGGTRSASSGGLDGSLVPTGSTSGPHFTGTGDSFRPLTTGCGPETADQCTGSCEQGTGKRDTTVVRAPATLCFSGDGDATPDDPAVVIEQVVERVGDKEYVHIRVTFDPAFTDNTYGEGSCCGWPVKRGHRFGDLTASDHTELRLTNTGGDTVMNFKIDYVTADPKSACGYGTLGVTGGDGSVIVGDASAILAASTSLDRNLNGCGYCTNTACGPSGECTVDSPTTDTNLSPNPKTPNWDYRQVYEVWIDASTFGSAGFGQAYVTYTHSSPAKTTDTLEVTPSPCPPTWDTPYCPPGASSCFGTPPGGGSGGTGAGGASSSGGAGGTSSAGGSPGSGGSNNGSCPPNYQLYLATEGAAACTPIPFANYPNHGACPAGYVLDLASEGQYCLPAK